MGLNAIDAISSMVAPVVLLTVGSLISNGLLVVYNSLGERMREMTSERIEMLTGPSGEILDARHVTVMSRERLDEIKWQLPMLLRRHRLTRAAVLIIYSAIALLGLSIIFIAVAVVEHTEVFARVALAVVLTGTLIMIFGIGVAGLSLARSADAITYAVERTQSLGRLDIPARPRPISGGEFDERDNPARHEPGRPDGRASAGHLGHLDHSAPGLNLDPSARSCRANLVRLGAVADIDDDLDAITFHGDHPNTRTSIRYPFQVQRNGICLGLLAA